MASENQPLEQTLEKNVKSDLRTLNNASKHGYPKQYIERSLSDFDSGRSTLKQKQKSKERVLPLTYHLDTVIAFWSLIENQPF